MDIQLSANALVDTKANLLTLPVFEEDLAKKGGTEALAALDGALGKALLAAATQEGFKAKAGQKFAMHTLGKLPAARVLLVGLGAREKFGTESLRVAAGAAAKEALRSGGGTLAICAPLAVEAEEEVRAVVEGLGLGAYRFDKWRSKKDDGAKEISKAIVCTPGIKKNAKLARAVSLGTTVADATNFARDLVNEPAMTLTPTALAQAAQKYLKGDGLQITVHDRRKIESLKMGMFLGVAQGSAEPPRLIEIRYVPKGAAAKAKPLALVGKAITFDSGGLSLKPADAMVDMKTDMAGSAAVFAAMHVIATEVQPKFPVYAFVGTCENMPSGTAYRPGDVLTSRLGKTVEVTNTDAEGRLVLGDVLTYACETKPRGVIDLATLTGACIVALGNYTVGTFGRDEELVNAVLDAAKAAGEDYWRLPLVPEVKDVLKSDIADMKNSGVRWGGAISAAHFLEEFVGETPWVHLDIAGPSTSDKDRGYVSKGGTGVGVRTLVELVRRLDGQA